MTDTKAEAARKASTPWRTRAIRITPGTSTSNAQRQQAALKRMSDCERLTGLTADQLEALHAEQRARVRARYEVSQ